jgi:hypothetical protein
MQNILAPLRATEMEFEGICVKDLNDKTRGELQQESDNKTGHLPSY